MTIHRNDFQIVLHKNASTWRLGASGENQNLSFLVLQMSEVLWPTKFLTSQTDIQSVDPLPNSSLSRLLTLWPNQITSAIALHPLQPVLIPAGSSPIIFLFSGLRPQAYCCSPTFPWIIKTLPRAIPNGIITLLGREWRSCLCLPQCYVFSYPLNNLKWNPLSFLLTKLTF